MKSSSPPFTPTLDDLDEESDRADAKLVWTPGGERQKFLQAKAAIQRLGFRVRCAELVETHPVWFFRLMSEPGPENDNQVLSLGLLRDLLWPLGVYFRDEDVVVQCSGKSIFVSLLWPTPACGEARLAAGDEGCLQDILNQLS